MTVRMVPGAALTVGALVGIAAAALVAVPAHAHNVLGSTSPAAGSTVAPVPSKVALTFDQTVLGIGTGVKVTGPDGDVQTGTPTVVDNTVTQQLRAGSPPGSYTVAWRVTSVDGHPISSSFTFKAQTVAGSSARATATSTPTSSTPASSTPTANAPTASTSAVAAKKEPGSDTSWTKVLVGGGLGALLGLGYVLVQRRRKARTSERAAPGSSTSDQDDA